MSSDPSPPLRLLRLTHSLNPVGGGVAEAIRLFGLAAPAAGCDLTVVCLDDPQSPWLSDLPFKTVALGSGELGNRFFHVAREKKSTGIAARTPAVGQPPLRIGEKFHGWLTRGGGYGYSPKLLPWLRSHYDEFDIAIIDGLWQYHGWAAYRVLRGRLPYCVMPHGMLDPWFRRHYALKHIKKCFYWWMVEHRGLRHAECVIFTAEEERRKARLSFRPYRACEKIAPLGIEYPEWDLPSATDQFRKNFLDIGEDPYVLFIGRLNEKKGVDLLIKAYRRLEAVVDEPPARLLIAGPGLETRFGGKLRELAKGSERIHFTGMLKGKEKWGALAGARMMVLPSHQENFGIVVAESLAVGTPVMLSREVDISKEVCNSGAGWVEADTEDGVFSLLQRQHSAAPQTLRDMRMRAEQCFREHFDLQQSAERLLGLLRSY